MATWFAAIGRFWRSQSAWRRGHGSEPAHGQRGMAAGGWSFPEGSTAFMLPCLAKGKLPRKSGSSGAV